MHAHIDKQYFEELFKEFYFPLKTYAYRFVQSDAVSEDMVQDVFTRLWAGVPVNKNAIKTWLFTSVRNSSLNYLKKIQTERKYADSDDIQALYHSAIVEMPESDYSEILRSIRHHVDALPEHTRRIFLLSRKYQMKNKDIAEFLDINIKTVEKHITKALHFLRNAIENNG
jgi:RNA polymerase sigma-70 factor (ECF subfamily)